MSLADFDVPEYFLLIDMQKIERFQKFDPNALSRETNIHFIPLFSPDRTHRDRHYDFMDESTDSDSSFYLPQPLDFSLE